MATYGKPQPPPPQPGLNAAYYGPPIPPQQPAGYYGPPPAACRRRGAGCLLCFVFKIIALVIIVLGAISLVLWLIFRPHAVQAYASYATPYRFDLGTGNGGDVLQHNLTVGVRLRNPNRFGIRYDYAEAHALYDGDRFGFAPLQPFYLDSKSDGRITAAFSGSAVVTDGDVRRTYQRETAEGFYYVQVKLYSDLSFKARGFRMRGYKSKVTCLLRLPVLAAAANTNFTFTLTRPLETKCDVDF